MGYFLCMRIFMICILNWLLIVMSLLWVIGLLFSVSLIVLLSGVLSVIILLVVRFVSCCMVSVLWLRVVVSLILI